MENISPHIDACIAMIRQQAWHGYAQLTPYDQRWKDYEDFLQDAFLTAVTAERDWRPGGGNKYSTHLYKALEWRISQILGGLRRARNRLTGMEELDAPVQIHGDESGLSGERKVDHLADPCASAEDGTRQAIQAFKELFRAVSDKAKMVLLKGLLARRRGRKGVIKPFRHLTPEVAREIRHTAEQMHITQDDLALAVSEEINCRELLTYAGGCATMGLETETGLRVLECVECGGQFTLESVRRRRFVVATMTCMTCLDSMSKGEESCFGKSKTAQREGYSLADPECRLYCNDRKECREFTRRGVMDKKVKRIKTISAVADLDELEKELEAYDQAAAEKEKVAEVKTKRAKAKVKAKVAKAKAAPRKVVAEDKEPPVPKGFKTWPFRRHSCMRYSFQLAAQPGGISAADFVKKVTALDPNTGLPYAKHVSIQLAVLRAQHYPYAGPTYTHHWKFDESGGRYRVHDFREVEPKVPVAGEKKAPAAEKEKVKTKAVAKAKPAAKKKKDVGKAKPVAKKKTAKTKAVKHKKAA